MESPGFEDMNGFIAKGMADISSAMRFRSPLDCGLNKLVNNLTPFPRLKFFQMSMARPDADPTIPELTT